MWEKHWKKILGVLAAAAVSIFAIINEAVIEYLTNWGSEEDVIEQPVEAEVVEE